jgi:hypothetical protein
MDFFGIKELERQTGHEVGEWPLVAVKELSDNALDACEEAGVTPLISVVATDDGLAVVDNGPGMPEKTLAGALDFAVRASSREAYVSPCRGAQGHALKTLIPMPTVIDPKGGRFVLEAHGRRHAIACRANPISQRAEFHDDCEDGTAASGTTVGLSWTPREDDDGNVVWPFDDLCPLASRTYFDDGPSFAERCRELLEGYALFNPHATIRLDGFGEVTTWEATDPAWQKWKPYQPPSAHWYEEAHLSRQIGAYITHDRENGTDRLVSDFLKDFDGFSGSAKRTKVLDQAGLKRAKLSSLVKDGRLDTERVALLLSSMRAHTRPVQSARLGVIGEEHFKERFLAMGVLPESFRYRPKLAKSKNSRPQENEQAGFLPYVLECAFGYLGPKAKDRRRIYLGANWSAAIKNPFRSFGNTGEGLEGLLTGRYANHNEPVIYALHLTHPRMQYLDRAKSEVGGLS